MPGEAVMNRGDLQAPRGPWWLCLVLRTQFGLGRILGLTFYVLAVALMSASLHLAAAAQQSPAQIAAYQRGDFAAGVRIQAEACDADASCRMGEGLLAAAAKAGAKRTSLLREAGVRADKSQRQSVLVETDWAESTFPERYVLVEGAWPRQVGEVAVPAGWGLKIGEAAEFYGGALSYKVTALIDDLSVKEDHVVAAPVGTLNRLRAELLALGSLYRAPDSAYLVRLTGGGAEQLASALADAASPATGIDAAELRAEIVRDLAELHDAAPGSGWPDMLNQVGVLLGWAPLLAVPLVFSLIATSVGSRARRRVSFAVHQLGLPSSTWGVAGALAWTLPLLTLGAIGVAVGDGVGAALRPVLDPLVQTTLSPANSPLFLIAVVVGISAAALAGAVLPRLAVNSLSALTAGLSTAPRTAHALRWSRPAMVIAALGLAGYAVFLQLTTTFQIHREGHWWSLCMCAAGSLVFGVLLSLLQDLRGRAPLGVSVAMRRAHRRSSLGAVIASVTMLGVALPLTVASSHAMNRAYSTIHLRPVLGEGQVLLGGDLAFQGGVPDGLREKFEEHTGLRSPVAHRNVAAYLSHNRQSAGGGEDTKEPRLQGRPLAFESAADLSRFLGIELTPRQREVFDTGGMLVPEGSPEEGRVTDGQRLGLLDTERQELVESVLVSTPLTGFSKLSAINFWASGYISTATARLHRWSVSPPAFTYTGIDDRHMEAARRAPSVLNFDPDDVKVYEKPGVSAFPPEARLTQNVLLGLLGVFLFVVSIGIVSETRPLARTLSVLGLPSGIRWTVVGSVILLTAGIPLVLGHVLAVWASVTAVRLAVPGMAESIIPWQDVALNALGGLCVLIAAPVLATAFDLVREHTGGRRLRSARTRRPRRAA